MEPLVSIIIPNFNRAKLIWETLDSIIAQTYTNWECIIVDDGSTDESMSVIASYVIKDKRIKCYKRPRNKAKGANACRNYGLELSKGDYINWFDSDDLMHPDKLQLQMQALKLSHKPFCVCQSYLFEGSIDNILGYKLKQLISSQPFKDFLKKKIVWRTSIPIFRKDIFDDGCFYFDENLQAGQEWELFTKIIYEFKDYEVVDLPLVYLRKHSNSISGMDISTSQLWWYYLARYKIHHQFKTKLEIDDINYLKRYFLLVYKSFLRHRAFKKAFQVWRMTILTDSTYSIKQHFLLGLSFFSFLIFKKGDAFLVKVHKWT